MKLAKMSLAAALLIGANAFALENVTFGGNAQLFYGTVDGTANGSAIDGDVDLFDKAGAFGNASASIDAEYKGEKVTVNAGATFLTTMGLENTLVEGIWAGNTVKDQLWLDEAKLTFSPFGQTSLMVGRQYIDTPLAFSETWNIVSNSMDAAVVVSSDIPDTTLVGAFVGRGNGTSGFQVVDNSATQAAGGNYNKYGTAIINAAGLTGLIDAQSAYAVGVVNTSVPMTTLQGWYYDVVHLATAYWLQGDVAMEDMGLSLGAQYASINPSDAVDALAGDLDETTAYAVKVGFAPKDMGLSLSAAYSSVEDGNSPIQMANTATGAMGGAQSKLYTEAWWNFGYVGVSGTDAITVAAEYGAEIADLGLYYTGTTNDDANVDMTEVTVTAGRSYGALDATLAYVYTDADDYNAGDAFNNVQLYLTYNF